MSLSLLIACLWALAANVIAMTPSRDHHWRNAYVLISLGVPLLVWIFWVHGPWVALLVFAGACSILRWPVIYAVRWCRRLMVQGRGAAE
ncbi:MAG: DUF2484 family protein [Pseudomonadota bacterium]